MLKVFGLKNCYTCRKARGWLDGKKIAHAFLDVRADGIAKGDVQRWVKAKGWETVLNKRGTTWRGLADKDRDGVDEARAVALMVEHPALIKRPVFEATNAKGEGEVVIGFGAAEQKALTALLK